MLVPRYRWYMRTGGVGGCVGTGMYYKSTGEAVLVQ